MVQIKKKSKAYEYKVGEVIGDGSCFFRALYNAARNTGNIFKLIECFMSQTIPNVHLSKWTEDYFVDKIRKQFSNRIKLGNDYNLSREIYEYLLEMYQTDKKTYHQILKAFPSWAVKEFKTAPSSLNKFRNLFAEHVAKRTSWVSELEVRLMQKLLMRCTGLKLVIFNNLPSNPSNKLDCNTMYLVNQGEVHYEYLLCRECDPKILNPFTVRCVNEQGATHRKIQKRGIN